MREFRPTRRPPKVAANAIGGGEISAATRVTAIFGDPVEHSLSPAMHNAAYRALDLDRLYVAFRVAPQHLAAAIRAIPALGLLGVNLTVPHKEQAVRLVDEVSAEARRLGAINCIVNRRGRLLGDNTDARGLVLDLRDHDVALAGRLAVIIGAGGGAAAAVLACLRMGAARIVIANRTLKRAVGLSRRLRLSITSRRRIEARGLDALVDEKLLGDATLVLNATALGLSSQRYPALAYQATPPDCLFYDLVYAREPTVFLKPALDLGRRALDGAGMLANQGALAFKLFNRISAPRETMRRALMEALGRGGLG